MKYSPSHSLTHETYNRQIMTRPTIKLANQPKKCPSSLSGSNCTSMTYISYEKNARGRNPSARICTHAGRHSRIGSSFFLVIPTAVCRWAGTSRAGFISPMTHRNCSLKICWLVFSLLIFFYKLKCENWLNRFLLNSVLGGTNDLATVFEMLWIFFCLSEFEV